MQFAVIQRKPYKNLKDMVKQLRELIYLATIFFSGCS